MTRSGAVFLPNPEHVRTYEQIYRQVYQPMYDRLKPLYVALSSLGLGRCQRCSLWCSMYHGNLMQTCWTWS